MDNISGNHLFHFTKMSPGLDGWRQDCCSSSNIGLMQPYSRSYYHARELTEGVPKERVSAKAHFTSRKNEKAKARAELEALKNFKNELVDYLKYLLDPYWHMEKITRNDYKLIVERSKIKVIDSFKASRIPHSQEKIDEYLHLSHSKLAKLVKDYVRRYEKW